MYTALKACQNTGYNFGFVLKFYWRIRFQQHYALQCSPKPQEAQCPYSELPVLKNRFQFLSIFMIKTYKTTLFRGVYGTIPLYYH